MMKRVKIFAVAALLFAFSACYVPYHEMPEYQGAPVVFDAQAACYWNDSYQDYIWYFDAWVDHSHGFHDIEEVWVDIYYNGAFANSYQLVHDNLLGHEYHWFVHKKEFTETNLWCGARYEMDFIAFDHDGGYDTLTIFPKY